MIISNFDSRWLFFSRNSLSLSFFFSRLKITFHYSWLEKKIKHTSYLILFLSLKCGSWTAAGMLFFQLFSRLSFFPCCSGKTTLSWIINLLHHTQIGANDTMSTFFIRIIIFLESSIFRGWKKTYTIVSNESYLLLFLSTKS